MLLSSLIPSHYYTTLIFFFANFMYQSDNAEAFSLEGKLAALDGKSVGR